MERLIDADQMALDESEAYMAAQAQITDVNLLNANLLVHAKLQKLVADAPTVDAVPVVRCRDCKWYADNNHGEWFGCQMYNAIIAAPEDAPKPDDFCSYDERRESNEEPNP